MHAPTPTPHAACLPACLAGVQSLDEVQRSLDLLSTSCGSITGVLSATKASSAALLGETERLQRELEGVERRAELVNQFLDQYQLKPEEVRGRGAPACCLPEHGRHHTELTVTGAQPGLALFATRAGVYCNQGSFW